MNILVAILIFSIIIIIHEFGHYTFAKLGGIKVNEFSLGMGPRLFSFYAAGTRWSLKALPLGGSCMMEGEDESSSDQAAFGNKSVWVRILTVFGGPLFNFILAFLLSIFVISNLGFDPSTVTEVSPNSPAFEAGLREGDLITKFDGKSISMGRELYSYFHFNRLSEKEIEVGYERDGKSYKTVLRPMKRDVYYLGFTYDAVAGSPLTVNSLTEDSVLAKAGVESGDILTMIDGTEIKDGAMFREYIDNNPLSDREITLKADRNGESREVRVTPAFAKTEYYTGFGYNLERKKTDFGKAILHSFTETKYSITSTIDGLKMLVTGRVNREEIAGPIGITRIIGSSFEASKKLGIMPVLLNMSIISIIISANLGVMNLIPIPALDGGRLVFLFVEAIRRKPINADKEGMVHFIGFAFLMILMAFLFYNDIMRLIVR